MSAVLLYLLFFLSGVSGLIYQVVWVREFGNVFGNTIYSTSIVLAIFMLGLGVGSYAVGTWADRRYAAAPDSLLRAYGIAELVIAALGLLISLILPSLGALSAAVSTYTTDASGWNVLSPLSYAGRGVIALILLSPITLLMGGTLTLLIRHFVRGNVRAGGWTIALLYGANTFGAAAGAFLTDFVFIPASGLRMTQLVAVLLNVIAGAGALYLASRGRRPEPAPVRKGRLKPVPTIVTPDPVLEGVPRSEVLWTSLAIGLAGFAAMGMEILWLRHFNLLLGGFRAVFSLLLTVVLIGIGAGSLVGGLLVRRVVSPAQALMVVQGLFVASTLFGLATASLAAVSESAQAIESAFATSSPWQRTLFEFWFNARPMLAEVAVPALLMGCSFPLANAVIQRADRVVGRHAGLLYLANTLGAVIGSLVAGYVLLPWLGIQGSATVLASAAGLAIVPLYLATRTGIAGAVPGRRVHLAAAVAAVVAAVSLGLWLSQPDDLVLRRSLAPPAEGERVVAISEGVGEIIAVTEVPGRGRGLMTNGHPMSSTAPLD